MPEPTSRNSLATRAIVGERHYLPAQEFKDIIAMLGMEELSPEDRSWTEED